jgi:glutamate racemase
VDELSILLSNRVDEYFSKNTSLLQMGTKVIRRLDEILEASQALSEECCRPAAIVVLTSHDLVRVDILPSISSYSAQGLLSVSSRRKDLKRISH